MAGIRSLLIVLQSLCVVVVVVVTRTKRKEKKERSMTRALIKTKTQTEPQTPIHAWSFFAAVFAIVAVPLLLIRPWGFDCCRVLVWFSRYVGPDPMAATCLGEN